MTAVLYPGRDMVKVVESWTAASGKAVALQHGSGMVKTVEDSTEEAVMLQFGSGTAVDAVSYTHLTLPTKRIV